MTLSHVTGIGGWAERPPVAFQLKQNVSDLSDADQRYAEGVEVACAGHLKDSRPLIDSLNFSRKFPTILELWTDLSTIGGNGKTQLTE